MDTANPDPVVDRAATTIEPKVPIASLRIMRLHKLLASREGSEWSEQSVRALDDSFKSGTRFDDLPGDLKDLVRLLFVNNGPIYFGTIKSHLDLCRVCRVRYEGMSDNLMEMINEVYFQENVFHFDTHFELHSSLLERRETRNMRRVGVDLKGLDTAAASLRGFSKDLGLFNHLQELEMGVDEAQMVQAMCQADQSYSVTLLRPQDIPFTMNKLVLRMRGLDHLQQISVSKVSFTGWIHKDNPHAYYSRCTGPVPGGLLETIVAPNMMRGSKTAAANRENRKRKASTSVGEHQLSETPPEEQAAKQRRRSTRIQEKTTGKADGTLVALPTLPAKRARKPPARFRFCDLPAELRNRIYYWTFYNDGPIHLSTNAPTSSYREQQAQPGDWPQSSLALLMVCRQVYKEALGLYYSQNRLVFYYPLQATMFLQTISSRRASFIRDIELWYKPSFNQGGINLFTVTVSQLSQLPNLTNLSLVLDGRTASKHDATRRSSSEISKLPAEEGLRAMSLRGVRITLTCPEAESILFHRLDENGVATPYSLLGRIMRASYDVTSAQRMRNGTENIQRRINGSS